MTERSRSIATATGIFVSAFAVRLAYWAYEGTQVIGDSVRALRSCQVLGSESASFFTTEFLPYMGFELPYCGFLHVTGGWIDGWIFVQLVLSSLSAVLLFFTAKRLVGYTAGVVAGGSLVFLWETFRWFTRPQSEMIFTFVMVLVLYQIARYYTEQTRKNRILLFAVFAWLAMTRPNGIPIVIGYLLYDLLPISDRQRIGFQSRRLSAAFAGLLGLATLGFLTGYSGRFIADKMQRGVAVTGKYVHEYTPTHTENVASFLIFNLPDLAIMALVKLAYFFTPFLPEWSVTHNLLNAATLLPLMVGFVVGGALLLRRDRPLARLWLTPVVMILLTIMATWMSGGMNFRAPATPVFALVTGYAVSRLQPAVPRVRRLVE